MLRLLSTLLVCLAALSLTTRTGSAQVISSRSADVRLSSHYADGGVAPAGAASTLLDVPADPGAGGDVFDVVTQYPQAVVTLVLPNGTEIGEANAAAQGFGYTVLPEGQAEPDPEDPEGIDLPSVFSARGTHTLVSLPAGSPAGTYRVKVNASALPTDCLFVANYYSSSHVRVGFVTDATEYRVGDTVVLSALVFNGQTPLTGANVTASIADPAQPSATPLQVVLQDSGPRDEAPGDGIYTGTFTANRSGKFAAFLRAGGTLAGKSFSRVARTDFRATPPLAKFVSFQDQAADDDGNGRFDRVRVTATADVQTAGSYQFHLTLRASNGAEIMANAAANLSAGSQPITVSFPAEDLTTLASGGPYQMREAVLTLQTATTAPTADYREVAGSTAAYSLASLEREDIVFTGNNTVTGIDSDRNGKYNTLSVQAEIDTLVADNYRWSGNLVDAFGREVGFASGAGTLVAGKNTLTFNFDGTRIGQSGVNGPYFVRSVTLFGDSGVSGLSDRLLQTLPYASVDFEGAKVQGDVNGDGAVNEADVDVVLAALGTKCGQAGYNAAADVDQDCLVDTRDLDFVSGSIPTYGGFTGGGQSSSVNRFLTYSNPTENPTTLPAGTTSYTMTVFYGSTMHLSSFNATLNGVNITSLFYPWPGKSQTVTIRLAPGRNVLKMSAEGVLATGHTATDTDRLVLIVP